MLHIRKKLPRRGGNNFYKDNRVFETATLCGAPVTDKDVLFQHAGYKNQQVWLEANCCAACLAKFKTL